MCGIFTLLSKPHAFWPKQIRNAFELTANRGPDNHILKQMNKNLTFGFHRLAIMDVCYRGDQPFYHPKKPISAICNGEIYNYAELISDYKLDINSHSDCEIIPHLYEKLGMKAMLQALDTESFAMSIYDGKRNRLTVARDRFGVRPLFYGSDGLGGTIFASEAKSIVPLTDEPIMQFPPATYRTYDTKNLRLIEEEVFDTKEYKTAPPVKANLAKIRHLFTNAVEKRLMSERPLGFLLSGGLDSSLVCAVAARILKRSGAPPMSTFSIGIKGSTDLKYAKMVANHIGSVHHSVECTEKEFLDAIPEVIKTIESYDTTTVRASVGNYLIGKYIKENTDIAVVFNGDGSDEQSGYLYLSNAPSPKDFQEECHSLLDNIHYFDVLRSDRSLASRWSLETRSPFLDKDFVDYYMTIDPTEKMYGRGANGKIEKYLLRRAFDVNDYLPQRVLWRKKEAFSDGCSSVERSWHHIIKEHVDLQVSEMDFKLSAIKHNPPKTKEAYLYRHLFETSYVGQSQMIPYFWMPKWSGNVDDPSARVLDVYSGNASRETFRMPPCL